MVTIYDDMLANWSEYLSGEDISLSEIGSLVLAFYQYQKDKTEPNFRGLLKAEFNRYRDNDIIRKQKAEAGRKGGQKTQNILSASSTVSSTASSTASTNINKINETEMEVNEREVKNNSTQENTTLKDEQLTEMEERFAEFWEAYPRKIREHSAHSEFMRINPDEKLFKEILSGLEKHKQSEQWRKENGQFIPYLHNWLAERRWTEELKAAKSESGSFDSDEFFQASVNRTFQKYGFDNEGEVIM